MGLSINPYVSHAYRQSHHQQQIFTQQSSWNRQRFDERQNERLNILSRQEKISRYLEDFPKQLQSPIKSFGTCFAHACAQGINSTQKRIIGRRITPHYQIVNRIVKKHGNDGGKPYEVLLDQLKNYQDCAGIRCRVVAKHQALQALKNGRAVIACFYLYDNDWKKLSQFYQKNPKGILQKLPQGDEGHAVAIVGYQDGIDQKGNKTIQQYFKVKNSWGEDFADKGYFKVAMDFPFAYFIDVFFRIIDLPLKQRLQQKQIKFYKPLWQELNSENYKYFSNYIDFKTCKNIETVYSELYLKSDWIKLDRSFTQTNKLQLFNPNVFWIAGVKAQILQAVKESGEIMNQTKKQVLQALLKQCIYDYEWVIYCHIQAQAIIPIFNQDRKYKYVVRGFKIL